MGRIIYKLVAWFFYLFFRLFFGLQIKGKENLPPQGPYIIVANHQHALDPTLVGAAVYPQQIHFMAKEELFKNPVLRWVFTAIGAFPVKRGQADLRAFKTSYQKIKEGGILGMFPEGTRQKEGEARKARRGVAQIIRRTGAEVIPVRVDWNKWRRPVKVIIGPPVRGLELEKSSKEELYLLAENLMERVYSLE